MTSIEIATRLKADIEDAARLGGPDQSPRKLSAVEALVVHRLVTLWAGEDPKALARISWTTQSGKRCFVAHVRRSDGRIEDFDAGREPLDMEALQ